MQEFKDASDQTHEEGNRRIARILWKKKRAEELTEEEADILAEIELAATQNDQSRVSPVLV